MYIIGCVGPMYTMGHVGAFKVPQRFCCNEFSLSFHSRKSFISFSISSLMHSSFSNVLFV